MQNWFKNWLLTPVRLAFVFLKFLTLLVFFTRVGEDSINPAWKAMDYEVDTNENSSKLCKDRPLETGIVETSRENNATIVDSITQKGLKVSENGHESLIKIKCDVVIVGSGCGGGVAAAVLANAGLKVIVL
ncbi:hypothetical protein ABTP16_05220, partial [Acinetobacter baumannii]